MSDTTEVMIRLFSMDENRSIETDREDYGPEHFGGTIPEKGDFILSPLAPGEKDRSDYRNREIHEVTGRYFYPREGTDLIRVALIVRTRAMKFEESSLL